MFRASSSTSSTVFPRRSSSELCSRSSIFCFSAGRSATTRCKNSAVSSSSRSGDFHTLDDNTACHAMQLRIFVQRELLAGEYDYRKVRQHRIVADRLRARRSPTCPGVWRSSTAQSICCSRNIFRASAPVLAVTTIDVVVAEQFGNTELLSAAVFDHQQAPAPRLYKVGDPGDSRLKIIGCRGLGNKRERSASKTVLCRSSSRVTICTGMCRVKGSRLSWLRIVQPSMSGKNTSSDTAVGWYSRASARASAPRIAISTLNPALWARSASIRA